MDLGPVCRRSTQESAELPRRTFAAYLRSVSTLRERIARWFRRQRSYQPPAGRLTEDTIERLPSGGVIQRMPGDPVDRTGFPTRPGPGA